MSGGVPGRSREISGGQQSIHPRLVEIVDRHRRSAWQRPFAAHTVAAFEVLSEQLGGTTRDLVLDAGCGTGASTRILAEQHRDCAVIGIDRSAVRLGRQAEAQSGAAPVFLVRAELGDFWRLAAAAGWRLRRQYLLYPNPYPKAAQVQRRWHAHPVFPTIVALGGCLELRSNWYPYVREMACALARYGIEARIEPLAAQQALSPFERKYAASGHRLWRLLAALGT